MTARLGRIAGAGVIAAALIALMAALQIAAWAADAADGWERGLQHERLRPEGLIEALRANGAQVVTLGSRGGLDGYFVTPADGAGYGLYVTGDGHAVAGLLYGPDGREVTGDQLASARAGGSARVEADRPDAVAAMTTAHAVPEATGPALSAGSRSVLFERSAAAFGFTLGDRGPVVVLLGDAACPWSRSAAARLGREALAGRLQLHVVPVAVLGADAARRAVAIASHPDPARAWFEGPERPADRLGGERIARNNALLDEWGAEGVPLIAWLGQDGAARHRIGDIDDVGAWLEETGLE